MSARSAQIQLLSREQVSALNRLEPGLDEEGFFVQVFLVNDQQNLAIQPEPFRVATAALDRISATAIGMPFLVWPDQRLLKRHFDDNGSGDIDKIIRTQQKFAIGEIVRRILNPETHNVSVIVRIFPEFVDAVKQGRIPPYVSPMIQVFERDPLTDEITDGRVIHLHAVDRPGYGPAISKISAKCDGVLGECMSKMRIMAAAGSLCAWRAEEFALEEYVNNSLESCSCELSPEPNMGLSTETKQEIKQLMLETLKSDDAKQLFAAAGAAVALEDPAKGKTADAEAEQKGKATGAPVKPAASKSTEKANADAEADAAQGENDDKGKAEPSLDDHPVVKGLRKELDDMKAAAVSKEREALVAQIVEAELALHEIPVAKRQDRIKEYRKLEGEEGTIGALKLLLRKLNERRKRLVGAAGSDDLAILSFDNGSGENDAGRDYVGLFDEIGRGS